MFLLRRAHSLQNSATSMDQLCHSAGTHQTRFCSFFLLIPCVHSGTLLLLHHLLLLLPLLFHTNILLHSVHSPLLQALILRISPPAAWEVRCLCSPFAQTLHRLSMLCGATTTASSSPPRVAPSFFSKSAVLILSLCFCTMQRL